MTDKALVISQVCESITRGSIAEAAATLTRDYPFAASKLTKRAYGPIAATKVFVRDGFIDRYSGQRVIFPPVLRVLSARMPDECPFHPTWKTNVTHSAYWELSATIDHLVPITRGGADADHNWVTTSMARNSAKLNWTVEELGWSVYPGGDMKEWDGLLGWFMDYTADDPKLGSNSMIKRWRRAATIAMKEQP